MTSEPHSQVKTILIADDDRQLVEALALRAGRLGLEVMTAYDALAALKLAFELLPDAICMDIEMPYGNGLSACEMLAADPRLRRTPVIVLTGKSDPNVIRRCHELCAFFVPKGPQVWSRVEPLLRELLELPETPASGKEVLT